MYWNNPLIEIFYPSDRDPVQESLHNNNHCIFYDPAVNNGNHQWSAGSGVDAQPYFRIFNPWTQG